VEEGIGAQVLRWGRVEAGVVLVDMIFFCLVGWWGLRSFQECGEVQK